MLSASSSGRTPLRPVAVDSIREVQSLRTIHALAVLLDTEVPSRASRPHSYKHNPCTGTVYLIPTVSSHRTPSSPSPLPAPVSNSTPEGTSIHVMTSSPWVAPLHEQISETSIETMSGLCLGTESGEIIGKQQTGVLRKMAVTLVDKYCCVTPCDHTYYCETHCHLILYCNTTSYRIQCFDTPCHL